MLRLGLLLALASSLATAPAAEKPELYVTEVQESDGPKPLKMRLEEIEREPKYSIVQVTRSGGASVPSIMFVVRGMWEIARRRDAAYFINLKEWSPEDGKWLYKVGFAETDQTDTDHLREDQLFAGAAQASCAFLSCASSRPNAFSTPIAISLFPSAFM